jgi:transposase
MKQKEAAKEFKVSIFTISYWLRKLGFSYKKSLYVCGSQPREEARIFKRDRGNKL